MEFHRLGCFYGILLIAEKYLLKGMLEKLPTAVKYIGTMIVVMIGWVFFSSETLTEAVSYIGSMLCLNSNSFIDSKALYLLNVNSFSIIVMGLSAAGAFDYAFSSKNSKAANVIRYIFYVVILVLCVLYLISETYNPFLYFRF